MLSERDDLIVRAVYDLHFVTAEQLCKLYFSPGSLTHVREILKQLTEAGYLHRLKMPSSQDGVKPFVYTLGNGGRRYLKRAGVTEFARFRPSEQAEHSYLFLEHTSGVNEIVIAAKALSEKLPQAYQLADFLHERVLKRQPVQVSTPKDGKIAVIPDLWLDFHLKGATRASIVLEYDRGTVSPASWHRKIRGLLAFAAGPYQEAYGSDSLTIAIATTAGTTRASLIRSWIEHELESAARKQDGELFLVAETPEHDIDPLQFFVQPHWLQPFGTEPVALLGD